jgi:hypothetical protein
MNFHIHFSTIPHEIIYVMQPAKSTIFEEAEDVGEVTDLR